MDLLPPPSLYYEEESSDEENVKDDGFFDIPLDDTSDDDGNGLSSPLVETSDSLNQQLQLPIFSMVPETPLPGRQDSHMPSLPALLWFANLAVAVAAPAVCMYGAVVPLLEDTVPFLAGLSSRPDEVTSVVQAACMAFVLVTTGYWYAALVARPSCMRRHRQRDKYCAACEEEVPVDEWHCEVCGECVEGRQHHSVLLNRCVGAANVALYRTLMKLLTTGAAAVLVLFLLEAVMGQPWRLLQVGLLLCCALGSAHCHNAAAKERARQACRGDWSLLEE
ncbi:Palmitoyltransferase erf2 [Chionoecetes opilio]|uniref:Palmitoyltransferase n=1 Tax=Chionoecetes opilio TaxID=41210 RepID=A0A8J5CL66_CHIOP|nr:Palmitoyltransferase erf2 [Chionoecetes opilio]